MIKSVTVTNYLGESVKINLSDGDPEHGMIVTKITGLGPPKANIIMKDLVSMDGSMFSFARAESRNIVIEMIFGCAPIIEDTRQRTYKYFPIKKPVAIKIETDNRILETVGFVESNEPDIFSPEEGCQISIICEDSFLYSDYVSTSLLYGAEPLFEFIFSNESAVYPMIEFSSISIDSERRIYYNGDTEAGMVITIHIIGPVSGDITIINTKTRESLIIHTNKVTNMADSELSAGDDIIIDTTSGNRKATLLKNGEYINVLNILDRNSDWLMLSKGENRFAYSAEYGYENIEIKMENRTLYEGI